MDIRLGKDPLLVACFVGSYASSYQTGDESQDNMSFILPSFVQLPLTLMVVMYQCYLTVVIVSVFGRLF